MLIVKDFEKLKEHGFVQHDEDGLKKNENDNPIWFKKIGEDENENYISLLVNPYKAGSKDNEMVVYSSINYSDEDADVCARIDEVFEMIADGTIEYVKDIKVV